MSIDHPSCILCCEPCDEATDCISSIERWENIKRKALLWEGLDRFGNVHEAVDWHNGPTGQYVHDSCRFTYAMPRNFNRQRKESKKEYLMKANLNLRLLLKFLPQLLLHQLSDYDQV